MVQTLQILHLSFINHFSFPSHWQNAVQRLSKSHNYFCGFTAISTGIPSRCIPIQSLQQHAAHKLPPHPNEITLQKGNKISYTCSGVYQGKIIDNKFRHSIILKPKDSMAPASSSALSLVLFPKDQFESGGWRSRVRCGDLKGGKNCTTASTERAWLLFRNPRRWFLFVRQSLSIGRKEEGSCYWLYILDCWFVVIGTVISNQNSL